MKAQITRAELDHAESQLVAALQNIHSTLMRVRRQRLVNQLGAYAFALMAVAFYVYGHSAVYPAIATALCAGQALACHGMYQSGLNAWRALCPCKEWVDRSLH
jgi:hypothetical protein